jgi:vacuolar-type H+-ATPase subunit F/Vma7
MRLILKLILPALLMCGCSENKIHTEIERTLIEDALTLELSFGDENNLNEFLLATPGGNIAVADNGDMLVSDESKIKVFDSDGNPKKILGGKGQGPGEFSRNPYISLLNDTDILGATDNGRLTLYNSEYNFISTRKMKNHISFDRIKEETGWNDISLNVMYAYSEGETMIFSQSYIFGEWIPIEKWIVYYHFKDDSVRIIYADKNETEFVDEKVRVVMMEKGKPTVVLLPNRRLVYTNTSKDFSIDGLKYTYIITIENYDTKEKSVISREYIPVAIPDSVIYPEKREGYNGKIIIGGLMEGGKNHPYTLEKYDEVRRKHLLAQKYYPGIRNLFADGDYLFVITNEHNNSGNIADVFDTRTGKYLSSFHFAFNWVKIHNGYLYKTNDYRSKNIFPKVEKYRINPAVYRK